MIAAGYEDDNDAGAFSDVLLVKIYEIQKLEEPWMTCFQKAVARSGFFQRCTFGSVQALLAHISKQPTVKKIT